MIEIYTIFNQVPIFILITIFGCCSNVYSFEKLLQIDSQITTLVTLTQFVIIFIIVSIYLKVSSFWDQNIKTTKSAKSSAFNYQFFIPIFSQVLSSYLGNLVFQYDLPMPAHIIFRSSGTAMTILLGWLIWNKKYGNEQIIGSTLIAIGTMLFTIDVSGNNGGDTGSSRNNNIIGYGILIFSTLINSLTSLYKEHIYQDNSTATKKLEWKEVLYYNYLYGMLVYIPLIPRIFQEYEILIRILEDRNIPYLEAFGMFSINWITQLICILGVNLLCFKVSALSLTIILLIRRFLSLILSIIIFNNPINFVGIIGSLLVFFGALIYAFGGKKISDIKTKSE